MIDFDGRMRDVLGGDVPPEIFVRIRDELYATLEDRVGRAIVDLLDLDQLDAFEALFEAGDDAGAFRYLQHVVPTYGEIVADQLDTLLAELARRVEAAALRSG